MTMKRYLLITLALCSMLHAQSADPDTTNTLGARIDTDTEADSFLTALARGTSISATELGYLDGVTSNLQTQLNGKLPLSGGPMSGNIEMNSNDITAAGTVQASRVETGILSAGGDITVPNATGTLALTSDLTPYAPLASPTFTGTVSLPATNVGGTLAMGSNNITGTGNLSGGSLTIDTNTLFVDATNNRVGIGTSSPATELTILKATTPTISLVHNDNGSAPAYFNYVSGATGSGETKGGIKFTTNGTVPYYASIDFVDAADASTLKIDTNSNVVTLGAGASLNFNDNSGSWNGSTIAGPQHFSSSDRPTSSATGVPAANSFITSDDKLALDIFNSSRVLKGGISVATTPTSGVAGASAEDGSLILATSTTSIGRLSSLLNLVETNFGGNGAAAFDRNFIISIPLRSYLSNDATGNSVMHRVYFGFGGTGYLSGSDPLSANDRAIGFEIRQDPSGSDQAQVRLFARDGTGAAAGTLNTSSWHNLGNTIYSNLYFLLEHLPGSSTVNLYAVVGTSTVIPRTPVLSISGAGVPTSLEGSANQGPFLRYHACPDGSTDPVGGGSNQLAVFNPTFYFK